MGNKRIKTKPTKKPTIYSKLLEDIKKRNQALEDAMKKGTGKSKFFMS